MAHGEPPDDGACFFVQNSNFDAHDFTQFLVHQLGGDWKTESQLQEAVREQAVEPADEEPEERWSDGAV